MFKFLKSLFKQAPVKAKRKTRKRSSKYPMMKMKVGDSQSVGTNARYVQRVRGMAGYYNRTTNRRFSVKKDGGAYQIKRVA